MSVVTSINSDDVAILLNDYQSGLFRTVKDIDVISLRNNVTTLVKIIAIENISIITMASESNEPIMSEIHKYAALKKQLILI